jgi:hypothetical protein
MKRTDNRHTRITQLLERAIEILSFVLRYMLQLIGRFAFDVSTEAMALRPLTAICEISSLTTGKCSHQ